MSRAAHNLERLIHEAIALPPIEGAACAGHGELFDDRLHGETDQQQHNRHNAARDLCATCPAIDTCRTVADSLSSAAGIWAGHPRTPRRPR